VARLGRTQLAPPWTSRVSRVVLLVQFTADLAGDSTASATVTAARSDAGAPSGGATASATVTAARSDAGAVAGTATGALSTVAVTASSAGVAGATTAAGQVAGVANIPSVRIYRSPFGRT
jgi:hypothetical protein